LYDGRAEILAIGVARRINGIGIIEAADAVIVHSL
jgi:hypothetical protein